MLPHLLQVRLERLHLEAGIGESFLHQGLDSLFLSRGAGNPDEFLKEAYHVGSPVL